MVAGVDLYEPQFLALFVFGGFVILSSIVYLVSAFSMQEKSYEEAIAEQRARLEKEQGLSVKEPKPKKKYSRKKKERERNENNIGHQDHMQEEIVPAKVEEVVEEAPPARPPPKAKSPKAKKEAKKAAAVAAKEPAAPKSSPKAPVEEKILPKVQQVAKAAPPTKPPKEKKQKIVEEPIMVQKESTSHAAAPPPKPRVEQVTNAKQVPASPSKSKKNKPSGDNTDGTISARSVIAALKSGKLNDSDIHKIAEAVQQRQHGSALPAEDWIKANQRSDPVAGLKKQLQEKEQALHNEILLAQSSSQKVKEIRAELVQEKSRGNQIENRYKEKMDAQAREVEALHMRMRQTHEGHAHENQALQAHIKQLQGAMDESNLDVVKQLREENARLKTEANHAAQQKEQIMGAELGRLNNELQKMQSQMAAKDAHVRQSEEIRRSQEAKTAQYDQQIKQYEQQIKQYEAGSQDNVNALSKRLTEVSEELRKSESRSHTLQLEMEKGNEALRTVTQERDGITLQVTELHRQDSGNKSTVASLEAKLKDSTAQSQNLDSRCRAAESKISDEEKLRLQKEDEIKLLQNDKTKLEAQINELNKKVVESQVQKSAPNGDLNDSAKTKEKTIPVTEHEKSLGDKVKTIEALQKQLEGSNSELEKFKKDVEKQTKKNNDLREKNWKAMEALNAAEKSSADKVAIAVKSAKDDSQSAVTQEQQLAKASLLKIFPAIKVDNKLNHKEWLAQFEVSAAKVIAEQSTSSQGKVTELSSKLTTVEEEKKKLSTQCQHYQTVLGETEGILHKLQSSVESEAKKWQEKLKVSEAGLVQSKRENAALKEDLKKKSENDKAGEENNRLTKELAASKASVAELEKSRQSASAELAGVKQQLTQLQKDLEAATQRAEKGSAGNAEAAQVKAQLLKEQEQVAKLTKDLSACSTTIEGLKQTSSKAEEQEKEIVTVKAALTKEKGLTKDLGMAAAKLQSALKKMQQALMEEKKVTATLKAQAAAADGETLAEKDSSMTDSQVELQLADAVKESPKAEPKAQPKAETNSAAPAAETGGSAV